ncbi:MAG: 50S ribosomal protein L21 [Nocardioidaceae bacterium]|nr:50S ribosomal protein L21 [Nocardioidaceae bacterium]
MYAIVRSGARQQKVVVGDVIEIDHGAGAPGDSLSLRAVLVVDGDSVTSDPATLADVDVTAEVVGASRGPKIDILKFKSKTGYRRRQGHRQRYTTVKVTGITGA